MTLTRRLQEKRDELAKEWTRGWNPLADETNSVIALNYKKGFNDCADLLLPEIGKMRYAATKYIRTVPPDVHYEDCDLSSDDDLNCSCGMDKAETELMQALADIEEFLCEKCE